MRIGPLEEPSFNPTSTIQSLEEEISQTRASLDEQYKSDFNLIVSKEAREMERELKRKGEYLVLLQKGYR